jgi:hypothetical protein
MLMPYIALIRGLTPRVAAQNISSIKAERRQNVAKIWPAGVGLLFVICVWLAFPTTGSAQNSASINGTIRDASAAVVPQASVVLKNIKTGVERTTASNDVGVYVLEQIPPGRYTIEVRKEGFTSASEQGVTLLVGQATTYDFTLSVGSATQTVTVEARVAALQTSTAELGTAVSRTEVNDLPLNGRNFSQLLALTPGVSPVNVSQNVGGAWNSIPFGGFLIPSVNGQTNRSNMFLLDGMNDNEAFTSTFLITPILDDIQEFKVDSHNDQPQFGGSLGGIVSVVTKSGTNALHGTGWEFVRNSGLDSRDPFFATVNPLRQNQFGANVGGPVVLPHYNGRNRTFFFGSYEGIRRHEAGQTLYIVPTPAELGGNLSDLGVPIYDPFSTTPDPAKPGSFLRTQYTNATIPTGELDKNMLAYAAAVFPAPVATGVTGENGLDNTPRIHTNNEYNIRADEQLNPSNSFWFRFSHTAAEVSSSGGTKYLKSLNTFYAHQVAFGWQHSFGASSILQLRMNRNVGSDLSATLRVAGDGPALISSTNISKDFSCGFIGGIACMLASENIPGYAGTGEGNSAFAPDTDIWEWKGDFSKVHGRHTFNLGADFNTNDEGPELISNANVGYSAFQTSSLETVTVDGKPISTGSGLASFLLGVPDNASRRNINLTVKGGWVNGFYFADQWKATDRLTVNLGLRYDYTIVPTYTPARQNDMVGDYDLSNGTYILQSSKIPSCLVSPLAPCIPGGVLPDHVVVSAHDRIYDNHYDNIQPRAGIAYRVSPKLAVRVAYGRFFDNWASITCTARNYQNTWPSFGQNLAQNLNPQLPVQRAENPFQGVLGALPPATPFNQVSWFADPHIKNPYSDEWNFGIQYQLSSDTTMAANYVGSRGSRLDVGEYQNVATTPGPGDPATVASRRPYPYITPTFYDQSIGKSTYNAFQFALRRGTSHGLAYLVSYTWSKSLDLGCSGWYGVEGCSTQDPYDLRADKGVSGFDLTHILTASWVYELPVGGGKRFSTGNRGADYVLGNWKLNGILTLTSGAPYQVGTSGDIANTGMSGSPYYERANRVGDVNAFTLSPQNGLNRAAFQTPAPYTFGNLARDSLRADRFQNVDFSIFREFPIRETKRFEFRADMFNLTNTATLNIPVNDLSQPNFGVITSTRSTERQIQLALKLYF